jgi:hypothetical protein
VKQVTECDKDAAAQDCPRFFDQIPLATLYPILYPGVQLRLPSVTLTLKALPHAIPHICLWISATADLVVSFKDFLVAESMRNQSNVFKVLASMRQTLTQ